MKISGVYIDGFGIFHDQSISDLDRDLVLFYGHNETGKSTLLGFIRSVLFGFPRANSKDPAYPPIAGGLPGGRVDLVTGSGETWSVSRKPGTGGGAVTVTDADGHVHDKAMLDQLLGGISYEAFRSIMAFGLAELQTMETLSGEHIASAIYGAGLGTSMMAMPRALKQIRKRMDDLFKSGGRSTVINRIAGELDRIRKSLHDAALNADQFDTTFDTLAAVEKEISSHGEKLSDSRRRKQEFESLERLWPDWISYQENIQVLSELGPATEKFPEDGLMVLETQVDKRDRCKTSLDGLKKRRDQLSNRLSLLPVNDQILEHAADITSLVENRNAYLENSRKRPLLTREEQVLQEKIHQRLSHLGSHWTEDAVLGFDRSLFTREAIRNHQSALDTLEKKRAAIETLLADKEAAFHQAEEARLLAEKDLTDLGASPPQRNEEALQRLKQGRDRFLDALEEYDRQSRALADARAELSHLEEASGKRSLGSRWPVVLVFGIGVVGAGTICLFRNFRDGAIVMGCTLVGTWATWVYQRQQRQMHMNHEDRIREKQRRADELMERCEQLVSIKKDYLEQVEASGVDNVTDIPEEALPAAVDRIFSLLSEEDGKRESIAQARRQLDERKAVEAIAQQNLEKVMTELEDVKKDQTKEISAWTEKCRDLGFSSHFSPATALEALDVIEETTGVIQQRDRSKAEDLRLVMELSSFRKTAENVFSDIGWPAPAEDDLPRALNELTSRLEESRGNKREKETLEGQMKDLEGEQTAAEKTLLETESAVAKLLEDAGIPDEAVFQKIGHIEQRRAELLSAARSAERNMRRISGKLDSAELMARLETLSLADIFDEKEAATEEARALDTELSDLYARRAELKQTLDALSTSDDISRLRAQEAALLADLSENAREWSRHAIAEHLILHARELFERKHQPSIIKDAGEIFSRMTDSRYQGVVAPLGENTIIAVDQNGERIPPDCLSRGTAEQLYLSVRFSYIRHQAQKSDPLPVIMDDILVNFDPVRARKAAESILGLTASHQVLMFTCHPETIDIFQRIDPRLPVFTLDGGRILPPNQSLNPEKSKIA